MNLNAILGLFDAQFRILYMLIYKTTMQKTAKHKSRRHKTRHHKTTRVKRGGMNSAVQEKLMYGILFSPYVQARMPLGLQFNYLLRAPPPNCDLITDARKIIYHSTTHDDNPMNSSREKTIHQILKRYATTRRRSDDHEDYWEHCRRLGTSTSGWNSCVEMLMKGCKAETELKELVKKVIQHVKSIALVKDAMLIDMAKKLRAVGVMSLQDLQGMLYEDVVESVEGVGLSTVQLEQLYKAGQQQQSKSASLEDQLKTAFYPPVSLKDKLETASSLFLWSQKPMQPMQLMENFKCDAPNFAHKIMNLYHKFNKTMDKEGKRVYYTLGLSPSDGINSDIMYIGHDIQLKMDDIKASFGLRLKMLEMVRDIAVPNMIKAYDEGDKDEFEYTRLPEFLFSDNRDEFITNIGAFKMHLDKAISQLKYAMGVDSDSDVIGDVSRMLREISHLPPRALTSTSLRLAPPSSAAVGKMIHDLGAFKLDPHVRSSLAAKNALKRLLVERLTSHSSSHASSTKKNARHLIGWHSDNDKDNDKDESGINYDA